MKNIQIIDGAVNCTYDIFAATEEEFSQIFLGDTDIEFNTDVYKRLGEEKSARIVWQDLVEKGGQKIGQRHSRNNFLWT